MQCKLCKKEMYVAHICPYCKEYYCMDHRDPNAHACNTPQPSRPQPSPPTTKQTEKREKLSPNIPNLQKNLFAAAFALIVLEQVLRQISYVKNSPFLEPNIYVAIVSQWLTPYIAAPLIFITWCLALFATKMVTKSQDTSNEHVNLIKKAIPLGLYFMIALVHLFSAINWLLILMA